MEASQPAAGVVLLYPLAPITDAAENEPAVLAPFVARYSST
jgi:hypothetical protein